MKLPVARAGLISAKFVVVLVIIVALISVLGVAGFRWLRPSVNATTAVRGTVVEAFYATGTISPEQEYPIKSHVAGIIVEMRVDKGRAVKQGEKLAVVEDDALPLKVKQAEAEYSEKTARADDAQSPVLKDFDSRIAALKDMLAIAVREEKRLTDAVANNAASGADVDRALDKVKQVESDWRSAQSLREVKKLELVREASVAKAALDIATREAGRQTVYSPIDGVVLDRPASLGTRLAINDHLMQVADVRPQTLVMRAQVDEEDKVTLVDGQLVTMTLYAFPARNFSGKVKRIYPQADRDRRTFEVDVALDTPDTHFAAGLTGELAFIVGEANDALLVPRQAVQGDSVWVIRDGKLDKVAVTVGRKNVERAQILSGLNAGDVVVISPAGGLKIGESVRPEMIDPMVAAGANKPADKANAPMKFN